MGYGLYHRVTEPRAGTPAEAFALARRIVTAAARAPASPDILWCTRRIGAVLALADRLSAVRPDTVRYDLVFEPPDPEPLRAALTAEGAHLLSSPADTVIHAQLDGLPNPLASLRRLSGLRPTAQVHESHLHGAPVHESHLHEPEVHESHLHVPEVHESHHAGAQGRQSHHREPEVPGAGWPPPLVEVQVGEHDEGDVPDEGLVAAVAAAAADDPLRIVWDCWFDGAVPGHTGVELCSGLDPDGAEPAGFLEVFVRLDSRTRDPAEVVDGIAAAARVVLVPDGRHRR